MYDSFSTNRFCLDRSERVPVRQRLPRSRAGQFDFGNQRESVRRERHDGTDSRKFAYRIGFAD